tara:strand:- start:98 stop:955 length:858 start_codon:yes stop_codon:yes gene_type:complete
VAIKPITNKQSTNRQTINRASQKSFKTNATGNERMSVNPGNNFGKGYSVTLKDIDTSVISHVKNIMKPRVLDSGEYVKVPVLYGNEERWKSLRSNGVLRDRNNSLILPVMVLRRTDVSFNPDMPLSFDHDIKGEFIKVERSSKWSKKNRYDRFSIQTGAAPITQTIVTGMPDFVVCNYSIVIMTAFMEQMNVVTEVFLEHLETYFGDSEQYKFLSSLEGGITDATEMTANGERIVKNEFSMAVKAYVIPEFTSNVLGTTAEISKEFSQRKVVFGFEGDATDYQVK